MVVHAIEWYIKVELLRTKQLPSYMTYSCIDRVPALLADIRGKASDVYSELYRRNDNVNRFVFADTGRKHIDGKVGVISSYKSSTCQYLVRVSGSTQSDHGLFPVSTEHMVPFSPVPVPSKYRPSASEDTCSVVLDSHFRFHSCKSPTITFCASAFDEIEGVSGSPHTKSSLERDRLVSIIERIESAEEERAQKVEAQKSQFELALSKVHSPCSPIEVRPRKKMRNTPPVSLRSNSDQVRHIWKSKVEHYLSQSTRDSTSNIDKNKEEHLFTFPFTTVDNTLHCSSNGLTEFSYHGDRTGVSADAVYERNNLASSIIIDDASVRSLAPGNVMDSDVLNFCLSWYVLIMSSHIGLGVKVLTCRCTHTFFSGFVLELLM